MKESILIGVSFSVSGGLLLVLKVMLMDATLMLERLRAQTYRDYGHDTNWFTDADNYTIPGNGRDAQKE